jgi:hypothetical protein
MSCCVCGVELTIDNSYPSCIKNHHYICKFHQDEANKKNKKLNDERYKKSIGKILKI